MTSVWEIIKQKLGKQKTPSPLEVMLESARVVEGHMIVDQYGDLYYGVSKKDSAVGEEGIIQETAGLDIVDKSEDLPEFHKVFITGNGRYVAQLGASYFLIASDGKLLSEGGHGIFKRGDRLYTGYGAGIHRNSRQLNSDLNRLIGDVFVPDPETGVLYVKSKHGMVVQEK